MVLSIFSTGGAGRLGLHMGMFLYRPSHKNDTPLHSAVRYTNIVQDFQICNFEHSQLVTPTHASKPLGFQQNHRPDFPTSPARHRCCNLQPGSAGKNNLMNDGMQRLTSTTYGKSAVGANRTRIFSHICSHTSIIVHKSIQVLWFSISLPS